MNKQQKTDHIRPSGGFRHLRSFQMATVVYDGTVSFCRRFIDSKSRLDDQMVQAARSGPNAGSQFWGCAKYPECKGSRPFA